MRAWAAAVAAAALAAVGTTGYVAQAGEKDASAAEGASMKARAVFGEESVLPLDERMFYSRSVNFAPVEGQVVTLNPPRFRWQYSPTRPGAGGDYLFTFQVAKDDKFEQMLVNVETEFNFYNTIAPLPGAGRYYWRVGYRDRLAEGDPTAWSAVRSFTVAGDAQAWDRSMMAAPDFAGKGHPRMLFSKETLPKLRELVKTHPESKVIFENMKAGADKVLEAEWYRNMPATDAEPLEYGWVEAAQGLAQTAFVWKVSGDEKYAGVRERAVTMARYPRGGRSGPQGAGGDSGEDSTQTTEFMGLLYDWLYEDLTEAERKDFAASLEWRIDSFINGFSWRQRNEEGRLVVEGSSLSTFGGSHPFEGTFDTFPAAVASYEDSAAAKQAFHLALNYMIGVGSAHGFDEGWNEGPGYGNSKWSWQVNSMAYLDSIFPEYGIGHNPWLRRIGEFFRLETPVGLKHAPWGHHSNRTEYFENGHRRSYRKLAYLTGDGRFLANWRQYGTAEGTLERPWIECALPLWREAPEPVVEEQSVEAFPIAGWVMAMSGPPSDPATYKDGVGMIFASRPMGGFSHTFGCENSFHLFGYGQDLSHGAGSSGYLPYAYSTMSHNSILVDGLGQAQQRVEQRMPWHARVMAFARKGDAAYWCGDATMAYPREAQERAHWWGKLSPVYAKMSLEHVKRVNRHVVFVRDKYFVILDDLEAEKPALWTWLYHALDSEKFALDEKTGSFDYTLGGVDVKVAHLAGAGQLDVSDRQGEEAYTNPITGESYPNEGAAREQEPELVAKHNVWVTTKEPKAKWRFLTVIYPVKPGSEAPVIERIDDLTARVKADGESDVISFDARNKDAEIVVDLESIAKAGAH